MHNFVCQVQFLELADRDLLITSAAQCRVSNPQKSLQNTCQLRHGALALDACQHSVTVETRLRNAGSFII